MSKFYPYRMTQWERYNRLRRLRREVISLQEQMSGIQRNRLSQISQKLATIINEEEQSLQRSDG